MRAVVVFLVALACQSSNSRSLPEDSVVSVYTTLATTAGTHPQFDVYHQIANNIAERITSPIYRFLGINKTKTDETKTTRRTWGKIELLDEIPEEVTHPSYLPVDNDISKDREVEELSEEALKKAERRPEKITLYSSITSYLPVVGKLESFNNDSSTNDLGKDDDDGLTLDDVDADEEEPRGGFVYILELLGSFVQLIFGAISSFIFPKPSSSS